MRMREASVIAMRVRIPAPAVCRRAWVRFLHDQGATTEEIGRVLGISREAADLLVRRSHAS